MSEINLKFDKEIFRELLKKFDRNENGFEADVEVLKEWIKQQPHLPEIMAEVRLRNFLLLSKCRVEKAKQKIDSYYTIRQLIPEFFLNPKSPAINESSDVVYFAMSPRLTKSNCRIYFGKVRQANKLDGTDPMALVSRLFHTFELRLSEEYFSGNVGVIDMLDVDLQIALKYAPSVLPKALATYEKMFSMPIKAVYIINSGPVVNMIIQVIKALVKPKILERIQQCLDASILHKVFEKDEIPEDYGGTGKSLEELQEITMKKIGEFQERFDQLDNFTVNENLRPTLKNDDMLGFYGSFKQIEVD